MKPSKLGESDNNPEVLVKKLKEIQEIIKNEQIQNQSRKIAELETRADYKEKMINELNDNMREVKKSMESLEKSITDFMLKSINDDSTLRELVNDQDNRITALETTNKTLKWVIGIGFSVFALILY